MRQTAHETGTRKKDLTPIARITQISQKLHVRESPSLLSTYLDRYTDRTRRRRSAFAPADDPRARQRRR